MELGQLKHFLAVYREGNFARAAQECGVTQQALSASIARLETHLGERLFERGRQGASATPPAIALSAHVERAFSELARGQKAMAEAADGNRGEVRFGIGQTFAGHIAPEAIAQMNEERPGVLIHMIEGYAEWLAQEVVDGRLDFFVGAPTNAMVSNYDLDVVTLFESADDVICRAGHPLAGDREVSVEALAEQFWLFPSPPSREENTINRAFAAAGFAPPERVVYSDTIATAQALVSSGDYLIVGQREVLAPLFDAGVLTTLKSGFDLLSRAGCIGLRRNDVARPCVQRLIDIIHERSEAFSNQII